MLRSSRRLLERGVDLSKLPVHFNSEAVDDRDDRERDAGGDQAVLDGGGARVILQETRNEVLHRMLHLDPWILTVLNAGLAGVLSTVTMPPT